MSLSIAVRMFHAMKSHVQPPIDPWLRLVMGPPADLHALVLLHRGAVALHPDLHALVDLLARRRREALDERVLVGDGALGVNDLLLCRRSTTVSQPLLPPESRHERDRSLRADKRDEGAQRDRGGRTGLRDCAVWGVAAEGHQEALLHVYGSDAHDGGEEEDEVGEQLHVCGVAV